MTPIIPTMRTAMFTFRMKGQRTMRQMPQFSRLTLASGKLLQRLPARCAVSVIAKFIPTAETALSIRGAQRNLAPRRCQRRTRSAAFRLCHRRPSTRAETDSYPHKSSVPRPTITLQLAPRSVRCSIPVQGDRLWRALLAPGRFAEEGLGRSDVTPGPLNLKSTVQSARSAARCR